MLNGSSDSQQQLLSSNNNNGKKKRLPAGTPDPEAEVVSLSPKTLLESDRFVCEICNQGFQRDQNLQMHRRRHKVPWKLVKRNNTIPKKRVYVCPEPSCLHHDPGHALGDLVGIKKHYRRKHSNQKQWVCYKCSKGYAVQSDYKAHLKTCGTRGHSCDCGRVFSRVESFIEHQDVCNIRLRSLHPQLRRVSGPISTGVSNIGVVAEPQQPEFLNPSATTRNKLNLELQLLTTENEVTKNTPNQQNSTSQLHLSIGSPFANPIDPHCLRLKEHSEQQLKQAMADQAYAEEARWQAQRQVQLAEQELDNAKRIRQQATAELMKAQALKEVASKQINASMLHFTCDSCNMKLQQGSDTFQAETSSPHDTSSPIVRYSMAGMKGWEMKKDSHYK